MLARRALRTPTAVCRAYTTARKALPVPVLATTDLETFRQEAFQTEQPALLPRGSFKSLPAIQKWFDSSSGATILNRSYLARFGSTTVPLEISNNGQFARTEQPLAFFLECVHASTSRYISQPSRGFSAYVPGAHAVKRMKRSNDFFSASTLTPPTARIYLAQASLVDLPAGLRNDVPTPDVVPKAGKGDVYDSSIWLGNAPTYTPLHKDPNPNLFIQLAGRKIVRLYRPETGRAIFAKVQEAIRGSASESMRGEEMMQGAEKKALELEVWSNNDDNQFKQDLWEAELGSGDGLFIPKGW